MTDSFLAEVEQTVDEYLARSYDADRRLALVAAHGWDPAFHDEIDALGWFALAVPESDGGVGLPLGAAGAAMVPLGRHLVPGPMIERLLLPALLLRHVDERSARRNGVPGTVVALVDPAAHGSWAVDGDVVRSVAGRLTGAMSAVRFGQEADLLLVVAEAADGVTVHLVPLQTPGIFVESLDSADPTARLARVSFSDCGGAGVVPVLAGQAAERFVAELHAWARILAACELSGIASRLVEITAAFVQVRRQFGRSIGSFQAVKHTVADMHVLAVSLRNLCDVALADAATCGHAELGMLGASTKAYAADAAIQVCQSAIQMHGGAGFTTETDLHLYYKRALALRAWYGDHEELTHGIGNALITGSRPTPRLAVS